MNFAVNTLVFIATVALLILVHECGHYFVAKWLKFPIERFSIGFGKPLVKWSGANGTQFVIAPILLGGYVKFDDAAYIKKPVWRRLAVLISGIAANLLMAILLFWLIFTIGIKSPKPIVGNVFTDSIAYKAGIRTDLEIKSIDGTQVHNWQRVMLAVMLRIGDKGVMKINSYQLPLENWRIDELNPDPLLGLGLTPYMPAQGSSWPLGMVRTIRYALPMALVMAMHQTWLLFSFNYVIVWKLIIGKISLKILGGPMTIFAATQEAFAHGFVPFLAFLALISIMLAFVNLLPIPMLDGGNFLVTAIEGLIGRPIPSKAQTYLAWFGMVVLGAIMFIAVMNDFARFFG